MSSVAPHTELTSSDFASSEILLPAETAAAIRPVGVESPRNPRPAGNSLIGWPPWGLQLPVKMPQLRSMSATPPLAPAPAPPPVSAPAYAVTDAAAIAYSVPVEPTPVQEPPSGHLSGPTLQGSPEPVAAEHAGPDLPQARLVTLIREQRALLDRLERATAVPPLQIHSPEEIVAALSNVSPPAAEMAFAAAPDERLLPSSSHAPTEELVLHAANAQPAADFALMDHEPAPMIIERAKTERTHPGIAAAAAIAPRSLPAFLTGFALATLTGVTLLLLL